jgi:hypothetical protein
MRILALLVLAVSSAGCASYQYDITRPPELARHIGAGEDAVFQRDPVEYRLRSVESLLVMRVYNRTDTPLTLLGEKSFAVDPSGQSHPLQSQTAAPRSFIKLIIPPPRPQIEHRGPTFGVGVGTQVGSAQRHALGLDGFDDIDDGPRYFDVYDSDAMYWDWKGETEIRLTLVFQQDEQTFTQEFGIARKKA